MMKPTEIFKGSRFENITYNVTKDQQLPFLIYRASGSQNFSADNFVYYSEYDYLLEYYFEKKDSETEKEIEEILNDKEIYWTKTDDIYLDEDQMFLIRYYI